MLFLPAEEADEPLGTTRGLGCTRDLGEVDVRTSLKERKARCSRQCSAWGAQGQTEG